MDRGAWRGLEGYSPRGLKESDTTEQLHFTSLIGKGFPGGAMVKNLPAMQEMQVPSLD